MRQSNRFFGKVPCLSLVVFSAIANAGPQQSRRKQSQAKSPTIPIKVTIIFWTKDENGLHGISLHIAAERDQCKIKEKRAYRIEGQVGISETHSTPIILEFSASTIVIDHAKVLPNCLANKTCAQGVGRIVDCSIRRTTGKTFKVIKVLHQCWNPEQTHGLDFHANYLLDNINLKLIKALAVGNLISLHGNVVSYAIDNTWEIQWCFGRDPLGEEPITSWIIITNYKSSSCLSMDEMTQYKGKAIVYLTERKPFFIGVVEGL
ncbi:uncharacterized protein MELLADRAFT_101280 [Melampsora larici-populina 98AG31]|uniref:Secreted protein n=1 Tax=Melampsora larici-populina (strain 98AG31 / pathotype 3-4-7) TaxID=747676 RepID=F4R478_MELLP|nr:uncharacterized protein MELLADRAFT_101280 [Melampsora larici-populina 98AG31]EGG12758.1 hypothetical protein MELLADRAFT_101280 [Melampsora larici-populina 98AG31]